MGCLGVLCPRAPPGFLIEDTRDFELGAAQTFTVTIGTSEMQEERDEGTELTETSPSKTKQLWVKGAGPREIGLSALRSRFRLPNTRTGVATIFDPGSCGTGAAAVGSCPPRLPPPDRQRGDTTGVGFSPPLPALSFAPSAFFLAAAMVEACLNLPRSHGPWMASIFLK